MTASWAIPAQCALVLLYLITLFGLLLYGSNAYVMVATHRRHRREARAVPPLPDPLPYVTVQLPLFNERYVAARLVRAVAAFDYPADRLEIQVLDDSTDDTSEIVAGVVAELQDRGVQVAHCRRTARMGFKAGALAEGLAVARGEFIAIFDADFVPRPDFLRAALPHFAERVAVVQARWGHLNQSYSALTIAQSLGMDGHFGVEQSARCWSGLLLNFNGTAGVWRKTAILDAGGWTHDTLTEDLDLSYRAQLRGWTIVYRPEIVCPAELPVLVTGFKSQQRRWAMGSIQTALKLMPAVWRADLPRWTRYQAFVHLTYYMIHPLMLTGVLLAIPLRATSDLTTGSPVRLVAGIVFGLATLGPATMLVYAQRVLDEAWGRRLWRLPTIMVLGVGVALSTSAAVLGAFIGGRREFVRTPKFGIDGASGSWRGKTYTESAPWSGFSELALGLYCACALWLFWVDGQYAVVPFLALYTTGFLTVGWLTIVQSRRALMRAALLLVALGLPALALAGSPDLVAEGERWWSHSPDPSNPVACATCHWDPVATRGWAASFPKWKPLRPPDARVMTLFQANAEAVARHYRLSDPRRAAAAITAYLAVQGAAVPPSPGITAGQPVFPQRLLALAASVERGRALYARRCVGCHRAGDVARTLAAYPRVVGDRPESLEEFVEVHPGAPRLAWNSQATADLIAYLTEEKP
jgi:mono/diheme cytochrome c family protein